MYRAEVKDGKYTGLITKDRNDKKLPVLKCVHGDPCDIAEALNRYNGKDVPKDANPREHGFIYAAESASTNPQKLTGNVILHRPTFNYIAIAKCLHIDPQYVANVLNAAAVDDLK